MTLAMEDNGKEIRLGANDSLLKDAYDATWLMDNANHRLPDGNCEAEGTFLVQVR